MARARNIKPGLYKNENLAECSILARYIFPGLWMLADREGRLEDRPKRIKGELLPYDNAEVEELLKELAIHGFILRYEIQGQRFIQILKFAEHQTPHVREQASTIPAPSGTGSAFAKEVPSTNQGSAQTSPRSPDSLIPESLSTDCGIPISPTAKPASRRAEEPEAFAEAWKAYPERPGASRKDALKAWKARIAGGVDPETILAGVRRYALYTLLKRTEPDYIKQPATFFGPGDHYLLKWEIHPSPARAGPDVTAKFDPTAHVNRNKTKANDARTIELDLHGEPI